MIFDGILLCSDWDGTLIYNGEINDLNVTATEEFKRGGGYFTICSGRNPNYFLPFLDKIRPNTYVIGLNGALIRDIYKNETLYEAFIDDEALATAELLFRDTDYFTSISIHCEGGEILLLEREDFLREIDGISSRRLYKILMIAKDDEAASLATQKIGSLDMRHIVCTRSWSTGFELLGKEATKGQAIKRLAKILGARLTIAVGDYENDIDMLRAADLSYAVGNAAEPLRAVADKITSPAWEGSLHAVIEDLKQNINLKNG